MASRSFVVGVGMTRFTKPGSSRADYPQLGGEAASAALHDAGLTIDAVSYATVGFCYADSCAGQRVVAELGTTGIPVVNVNNNCATGSTALYLAREAVLGDRADAVLAIGFDRSPVGGLRILFDDREPPIRRHLAATRQSMPDVPVRTNPEIFAAAAIEYDREWGLPAEALIAIAAKNHRHSVANPNAQFRNGYTENEIASSPMVARPLTRYQCSPTSDGAAAAVVASETFVKRHGLERQAVEIVGQAMCSDVGEIGSARDAVGVRVSQRAAELAYEQAGFGIMEAQVVELHDCFSINELLTYESLGMTSRGSGAELAMSGDTTYGGRWVVNPSGGLIAKGHPLGATGLAQCAEIAWQLRGMAGERQVPDARRGIQHNIGLGSAGVVTVYEGPQA